MFVSIKKFDTGSLVRLADSFMEERATDPDIKQCKVGIILGGAKTDEGILYKIHWLPINKIFYDEQGRLENYEKKQI